MSLAAASGVKSFLRGVHPPHRKRYSEAEPIRLFVPRKPMLMPMIQHLGAPCSPLVKAREEVTYGQKIGDVEAFISAPIHSSVNGTIGAGTISILPSGRRVPCLPITPKPDGPYPDEFLKQFLDRNWASFEPKHYEPEAICKSLRENGIVGMGGATFPTYVKLTKNPNRPIDTIVLNGCECEPYLTSDHRLMVECPEAIIVGLQLAMRAVGALVGVIAIESNKPDAIEAMRKASADCPGVRVDVCATKYPMGGERQLIPAVLGRTVPSAPKGLPLDVGVVMVNVGTAHAIARAVVRNQPLTHRVITVTGLGINKPGNWLVPIGAMFSDLLDACGGVKNEAVKVLAGGPMMGPTVPSLDVPAVKGTSGITVMLEEETAHWDEQPCIRCGKCIDNCPLFLSPTKIAHAIKFRDYPTAELYDMMACCECGCCSYVCPSHIPLAQYIRAGKTHVRRIEMPKKK